MAVRDNSAETDLLIIGAGPGGYVAAIRAGQLDLDVTLVDKEHWGGVCLNYGCIPSKALITATDLAEEAGNAQEMGVYADPVVDMAQMVDWKDEVVDQLTGGVEKLCKANGVTLLEGRAEFIDENKARIVQDSEDQDSEIVSFENAIIATGSQPIEIPGFEFGDEPVLDSRQALALADVPDRLIVVGAGYIGMELATVFAKAGSDVTVIEMLDDILVGFEDDLARPVKKRAEDLGIDFHFGWTAREWVEHEGHVRVTAELAEDTEALEADGAGVKQIDADNVLVAVGRQPVTNTLNLETVGLETDDRGFIETNERAQTSHEHIFAIGDVAGEPMLAHKASAEGKVAAEVVAGEPSALDHRAIPAAVFTDPEIGRVGLIQEEAMEAGYDPVIGQFPFQASGRALTTGHAEGFVRVIADRDSGFVLGGQVVGPEASELIAEIGLAVEMGATLEDVASTVHSHPTLSEAVMEAAENAMNEAIHTLNR